MKTVTLWTCDICAKESPWTENHEWFGSWKDFENKGRKGISVVCSEKCKHKLGPKKMDDQEWQELLDKNGVDDSELYDGIPCECTYPGESDGTGRCCNCGGWL